MIEKSLFIRSCWGEKTSRPPIWLMRQAGRYLPEYRKLRKKHHFLTMCHTPEIAAEITLQPIQRFHMDAAILFSDILLIPQAMGKELVFQEGTQPSFSNPIQTLQDIESLQLSGISEKLNFVYDTIKICKKHLNDTPLIGFAGAPLTVGAYLLQTRTSKFFHTIHKLIHTNPEQLHMILKKLTLATIEHLNRQIDAGVDAIQIFESWGHFLQFEHFQTFCVTYIQEIIRNLKTHKANLPIILFTRCQPLFVKELLRTNPQVISVDWTTPLSEMKKIIPKDICIQGNFNPYFLHGDDTTIKKTILQTLSLMRDRNAYIVNLGHGVLPDTPYEKVQLLVETVQNFHYEDSSCPIP